MPHACEHHRHPQPVGRRNHFGIFHRAARLNHRRGARLRGLFHSIRKRKKRIRRHHAPLQRALRFHHRNLHGIYAAHLSRAHTQSRRVLRKNDGVGFHVLAYLPRKFQIRKLRGRRLTLRDHLKFRALQVAQIRLLHQHATKDALHLQFLVEIQATLRQLQQAKVFLGREDFLRAIGKARRNDAFNEKFDHRLSRERVHNVVERQHAAERGHRVARKRFGIRIQQRRLLRRTAWIVVLDDHRGWTLEFRHQTPRRLQVHVIVVGKLLALQLLRRRQPLRRLLSRYVQRRRLVRILSVAQFLLLPKRNMHPFRQRRARLNIELLAIGKQPLKIHRNQSVVSRSHRKHFSRKLQPQPQRSLPPRFQFSGNAPVIRGIAHYGHALKILRRGTQHRRAANINVFDELLGRQIILRGRRLKRVKIHDHQINRQNSLFLRLLLIFHKMPAIQQPAVNLRMQRLHPPAQHFRPPREFRHIFYRYALFPQQLRGSSRGEYFDLQRRQLSRELQNAALVENADQRALHGHVVLQCVREDLKFTRRT